MQQKYNPFNSLKFSIKQKTKFSAFSNIEEVSYNKIGLVNSTSINYNDVEFINFLQMDGAFEQKRLLKELKSQIENPTRYLELYYEAKELTYKKQDTDRVLNIINRQSNKKINSISELIKFKNKKEPRFQIYIKSEDNVLNIYLIDLYHLGLPGDLWIDGKPKNYNRHAIYLKKNKKTTNVCISEYL